LIWVTLKDLRLLLRRRIDTFFVFLFPVVFAAFFTQVVSGSASGASRIKLAVVDQDRSAAAAELLDRLEAEEGLKLALLERDEAEESVRAGRRAAYLLVPAGWGAEASTTTRPALTLGVDPARQGEAGLLRGLLLRLGGELAEERLRGELAAARAARAKARKAAQPATAPPTPDAREAPPAGAALAAAGAPLAVDEVEVAGSSERPPVAAAVTLPQGTIWALLACAAAFGASLVGERTSGTLRRLRVAPVGIAPVLLGKALACFLTILAVCGLLLGGVAPLFGVTVQRPDLLLLAVLSSAVCFSGLMLMIGMLGGTEDAAYRVGWAIVLVLAMLGGAMIPTYLMPAWMDGLSWLSPVRWALNALEGAIWRGFTLREIAEPCGVLVATGLTGFVGGSGILRYKLARGWGG
jgi:ABC-2 type transport system permease protein